MGGTSHYKYSDYYLSYFEDGFEVSYNAMDIFNIEGLWESERKKF